MCGETSFSRRAQAERHGRKEVDKVERFIGYVVSFLVIAGMGVGLPRWFEWRRSLVNRALGEGKAAGHV